MTAADDRPECALVKSNTRIDEGLEDFVVELHRRRGVPERLRYPETDEEYDRLIAEARESGYVSAEDVEAWLHSLGTEAPLPRPRPG